MHKFKGREDWRRPRFYIKPCKKDRYKFNQSESNITDLHDMLCENGPMTRCQIEEYYKGEWITNAGIAHTLLDLIERGLVEPCRWQNGPKGEVMLFYPVDKGMRK